MYPTARNDSRRAHREQEDQALRAAWHVIRDSANRTLLALGAVSLLVLIPMLWLWIAYGGPRSTGVISLGGIALSLLAAGIGLAMIHLLGGER